jgi:hypothetical protein
MTCAISTARVAELAGNMCSMRSEASVMSCGVPKVVYMLNKASSPWSVAKRLVSIGAVHWSVRLPQDVGEGIGRSVRTGIEWDVDADSMISEAIASVTRVPKLARITRHASNPCNGFCCRSRSSPDRAAR